MPFFDLNRLVDAWELGASGLRTSADGIWSWSWDECGTSMEAQDALKGQKMNACNSTRGRGSPEIDIIEAQPGDFVLEYFDVPFVNGSFLDVKLGRPLISSSLQVVPGVKPQIRPEVPDFPATGEWYPDFFPMGGIAYGTGEYSRMLNNYWYGQPIRDQPEIWQDGILVNWQHPEHFYQQQTILRMEWQAGRNDGYVRWYYQDDLIFEVTADMLKTKPGDIDTIPQIPYEAMYLILNTDVSPKCGWNGCDPNDPCMLANPGMCSNEGELLCRDCRNADCLRCPNITGWLANFCNDVSKDKPAEFKVDYIRVYQDASDGMHTLGCDPPEFPTKAFINENWERYTFESFLNKQPLLKVQHGGGPCWNSSDCGFDISTGLWRGSCNNGKQCECMPNWTGPNWQVPSVGEFAECASQMVDAESKSGNDLFASLGFLLGLVGAVFIVILSCLVGLCLCCRRDPSVVPGTNESMSSDYA